MSYFYLTLLLLISSTSWAASCQNYEIKGIVRSKDSEIHLMVNEGTMSEYALDISLDDAHKFAPYIDVTVTGSFILKSPVQKKTKIEKVNSLGRSSGDPLNHLRHSYLKKKEAVKCP